MGVRAQLRHLKKISTWLWLIKIFYTIFFKEVLKASEKHANCLKTLYGKFRQFASVIQMFAKENEASPCETTHDGRGLPSPLILYQMAPQRSVQHLQTRYYYLEGKGPQNFHWMRNNPA